jgi:DNA-binding transcriptional ArsR family regulator
MDEIPAIYEAESLEQLRALADKLRIRIFNLLAQEPMTVTQVGKALATAPAKIHYHVRELERVKLVRQVYTREKSGILEKYYRAVARDLSVPRSLVTSAPRDELLAAAHEFAQSSISGYLRALGRLMPLPDEEFQRYPFSISNATLWLSKDDLDQFAADMRALFEKYEAPRGVEGEQETTFFTVLYPAQLAAEPESTPSRAEAQVNERPSDQPPPAHEPKINRVWVAGGVSYSRKDLEGVAARGERLDISVLGVCGFADDIPAELVERTIARFRCRGPLSASPAVRDVLKTKEAR